jgi:tRNA (guanine-N7-)-methyltransferase
MGIEQAGEYFKVLRERAGKRAMPNLRISRLDAAYLINRFFPADCVAQYHIYFPDPWPKKKHRKRRLFSESFCADLRRTLAPDGVLFAATDHAEYYSEMLPRLRSVLAIEEHPQPWEDAPTGRTNYEVKYLKEGRPIYRLIGRKA